MLEYADDTTIFTDGSPRSLDGILWKSKNKEINNNVAIQDYEDGSLK